MSWGERSCKGAQGRGCSWEPTLETCNVNCLGYRWDGKTKPDTKIDPNMDERTKNLHEYKRWMESRRKATA